jgi:uncharacterized protein YdiU (UPF0061 family)
VIKFDNSYTKLPQGFFAAQKPVSVTPHALIAFNQDLAKFLQMNFESLSSAELAQIFTGQTLLPGSEPIALAYAGHQFGHFNPQLGDGRALLLGETFGEDGQRYDVQLKGSGRTPFSRGGDGKSQLGPVLREFIVSEAFHHLRIPTTRSLAAVQTEETIFRMSTQPGAILTRVALSHIRIGTFEFFAKQQDFSKVRTLADYTIDRLYPDLTHDAEGYAELLNQVMLRQVTLINHWLSVGFIHGVMNTDNCTISGQTIDFGPCAFMDEYKKEKVFSSIDRGGRYAYGHQPRILFWNLCRLAECLIPLIDGQDLKRAVRTVEKVLENYTSLHETRYQDVMSQKIGLSSDQFDVLHKLLGLMEKHALDFTLTFRDLSEALQKDTLPESFAKSSELNTWFTDWKSTLVAQKLSLTEVAEDMDRINPLYIPRNHQIEHSIQLACEGDYRLFQDMNALLKNPFTQQLEHHELHAPPLVEERITETFCGT